MAKNLPSHMRVPNHGQPSMILAFILLAFVISVPIAWFTHIIVCIQNSEWLFLIAGAILVPIAYIHGVGIWFGLF